MTKTWKNVANIIILVKNHRVLAMYVEDSFRL